jgi:hypothetical protein
LNSRVYDFNAALHIAALRLTGAPPTEAEQNQISNAGNQTAQQTAYNALIKNYLARPTFATQMFYYWRDTFKTGGGLTATAATLYDTFDPVYDTAAAFATELTATNGDFRQLFTASTGTCPTFDTATGVATPANCTNGAPTAGVLTDAGIMTNFFSNFSFRRIRWINEIFNCQAFPQEVVSGPGIIEPNASAPYTSPWPFTSVPTIAANGGLGRIDFQSVSSAICADCHTTINHEAPLFAYFDLNGKYQPVISVPTPLPPPTGSTTPPVAVMTDYLVPGETTAWRYQVEAPTIPAFGADMAADAGVAECAVARIWNLALGKPDIVDYLETVPTDVIATQVSAFKADGYKINDMFYNVFTADDFVKF